MKWHVITTERIQSQKYGKKLDLKKKKNVETIS
jgi:hypothetical protein